MEREEAIEIARKLYNESLFLNKDKEAMVTLIPELKESEDERIREWLINLVKSHTKWLEDRIKEQLSNGQIYGGELNKAKNAIAWLGKQGKQNEIIDRDEFVKNVLIGAAINLITWIDCNTAEGNTYLSNMECKDIKNSLVNCNWNKIYTYIKKKLEKQGEKPIKIGSKNAVGKLGELMEKHGEQKPTFVNSFRTWLYIVADVLTEFNGIGQYLDNSDCREMAERLREKYCFDDTSSDWQKVYQKGLNAGEIYGWNKAKKEQEQKLVDKVEPKFKVGDWVVYHRNDSSTEIMNVYDIRDNRYYFNDNIHFSWSVKECDEKCHLWTIQDAKDGDILCSEQIIVLFKQWEDNTDYCFVIAHAGIDVSGKLQITNKHWLIINKSKPATKEQRDLLFSKMKEAGYEWNAEKKELKKIEQTTTNNQFTPEQASVLDKHVDKFLEQKLTENKDYSTPLNIEIPFGAKDSELIQETIRIPDGCYAFIEGNEIVIKKGEKPAWSEEDERMFNSALWHVKNSCSNGGKNSGEFEVYNWLKSFKDRVQPQTKQEWGEEDKKMISDIATYLNRYGNYILNKNEEKAAEIHKAADWIKSIKYKVYI